MKRGKHVFENDGILIYVGAVVFILLAISLGIIMYVTTSSEIKTENNIANQETETKVNTETVTSGIGKTVEEQEKSEESNEKQENITDEEDVKAEISTAENKNETESEIKNEETDSLENTSATEENITETKKEVTFIKPTEGEIICEYAKDNLIYSETLKEWITHTAIDIKADKTSVIKAASDGIVKTIVNDPRYGLTVTIEHADGYETVYSNLLTAEFVVEGEEVKQGQTIGTAGNTAAFESNMECHLHFELLKDGEYLDPTIYIK